MRFWCATRVTQTWDWMKWKKVFWRVFWKEDLATASACTTEMSCQGTVCAKCRCTSKKTQREPHALFSVCSCTERSVGVHRAEPDGDFGSLLIRFLSGVQPPECHALGPCGAFDSFSFHPNRCRTEDVFGVYVGGLAAPHRSWRSGDVEGLKLHAALLYLLEAVTILSTGPAGCEKIQTFTSNNAGCYIRNK